MGVQCGRDQTRTHGFQYGLEVFGGGVTTAHQRHLPFVELRVGEGNVGGYDGNQCVGATVGHKFKPALHGLGVASGIKHHVKELLVGERGQFSLVTIAQGNTGTDAQCAGAEVQPVLPAVEGRHHSPAQLGKNHGGHANGACAHDQHALPLFDQSSAHRVGTNGQKLHHRSLVQRDTIGLVHKLLRHAQVLRERTVAVYTQHLDAGAAVGLACAARNAGSAGQVGHYIDRITGLQGTTFGRFLHNPRELMPHHAWVIQIGLVAREDVQVGAAYAHALHAQQYLAFCALWLGSVVGTQGAGGFANNGQHVDFLGFIPDSVQ